MAESLKSDAYFKYSCSKCIRKTRNTEARWYCPDCDEYFCDTCKKLHDEFTRNHDVLDKSRTGQWGVANQQDIPQCPEHEGQTMTTFCMQHEALCCPVCSALDHSSCGAKSFIDNVDDSYKVHKMEKLLDDISSLKAKFGALKEVLNDSRYSLDKSKTNFRSAIRGYQEEVHAALAVHVKTVNEKMEEVNTHRDEEIETDLDTCDALSGTLRDLLMKLTKSKTTTNQTSLFLDIKFANGMSLTCRDKLIRMYHIANYDIKWSEDNFKLKCISKMTEIVNVEQKHAPGNSRPIKCLANCQLINVKVAQDKKPCDLRGICQLLDGTIIVSDKANKNLKRLDSNYQVTEVCELNVPPGDLCTTGRREIAIALEHKRQVMFVSITDKIGVVQTLTFDHICHSIAFQNGILYIVNGRDYCYSYEIKIVNHKLACTKLKELKTCETKAVTTSGNGEYIYIIGKDEDLHIYDRSLSNQVKMKHSSLTKYSGACICVDMFGNVIVLVNVGEYVNEYMRARMGDKILVFENNGLQAHRTIDTSKKIESSKVLLVDVVQSKLLGQRRDIFRYDAVCVWDIIYD